jgi:glucosamine--fructose-6-phosphate aminotransferase (isomerizing)
MALAGVTDRIAYLHEGDLVDIQPHRHWVVDARGQPVERAVLTVQAHSGAAELGPYRHYMQKEIFEQPRAVSDTLEGVQSIVPELFGDPAYKIFKAIDSVLIVACGTSYYAGLVARYWLELLAQVPTRVEMASEFRYNPSVPDPGRWWCHLAKRRDRRHPGRPPSCGLAGHDPQPGDLQRGHQRAGARGQPVLHHARRRGDRRGLDQGLHHPAGRALPADAGAGRDPRPLERRATRPHSFARCATCPWPCQAVLALEPQIIGWAEQFATMENALFLGRGLHYPIALEGALKLKEISYIHAEAYPAGELKHGPLALVTRAMPVVTVAPNDSLIEKLKSQHAGGARARRPAVRVGRRRHADRALARRARDPPARALRAARADAACGGAAAVGVSHGGGARHGCGPPRNLAKSVTVE